MKPAAKLRILSFAFIGAVCLLLFHGNVNSQTTINIFADSDNTMFEESVSYSNGIGSYLFTGNTVVEYKRRALIRFSGLPEFVPQCATIQSVTLTLHMSRTIAGPQPVRIHKVLQNWGEGISNAPGEEGFGAPAESGDATWNNTYYPSDNWANPGGDFVGTASASQSVGGNGYYTWSSAQMANDVKSWLLSPNSNFGWIIIGNEDDPTTAKRFDSKDNDSISFWPKLTVTYTNNSTALALNSVIEGFWNGTNVVPDTLKAYLRNSTSPYAIVDSAKAVSDNIGNSLFCFRNVVSGNYYIVVKHRNSVETWSALPQFIFANGFNFYDFTSSDTQAYGNNLKFVYPKFCIYSGDVNQNGFVDITDILIADNDAFNFVSGYVASDVNGDSIVDIQDLQIIDNNAFNFVGLIRP